MFKRPGIRLCPGSKNRARAEIIGPVRFRAQRLLHRVGGHTDNLFAAQYAARLPRLHILLSHMHSVRIKPRGKLHIIIYHKRYTVGPA